MRGLGIKEIKDSLLKENKELFRVVWFLIYRMGKDEDLWRKTDMRMDIDEYSCRK